MQVATVTWFSCLCFGGRFYRPGEHAKSTQKLTRSDRFWHIPESCPDIFSMLWYVDSTDVRFLWGCVIYRDLIRPNHDVVLNRQCSPSKTHTYGHAWGIRRLPPKKKKSNVDGPSRTSLPSDWKGSPRYRTPRRLIYSHVPRTDRGVSTWRVSRIKQKKPHRPQSWERLWLAKVS